jgi:hypothetical protein
MHTLEIDSVHAVIRLWYEWRCHAQEIVPVYTRKEWHLFHLGCSRPQPGVQCEKSVNCRTGLLWKLFLFFWPWDICDSGTNNDLRKLPTTIYTSRTVLHIVLICSFKKMNTKEHSTPPCYEREVCLKICVHIVEFHNKNAILPHCKYSCKVKVK